MGQAKARGNKEDRISQAVQRDRILSAQEAEKMALRRELDLVARRERMESSAQKDNDLDLIDAVVEQVDRSKRRSSHFIQTALIAAALGGVMMSPSMHTGGFRRPFNSRMF